MKIFKNNLLNKRQLAKKVFPNLEVDTGRKRFENESLTKEDKKNILLEIKKMYYEAKKDLK